MLKTSEAMLIHLYQGPLSRAVSQILQGTLLVQIVYRRRNRLTIWIIVRRSRTLARLNMISIFITWKIVIWQLWRARSNVTIQIKLRWMKHYWHSNSWLSQKAHHKYYRKYLEREIYNLCNNTQTQDFCQCLDIGKIWHHQIKTWCIFSRLKR